MKRSSLTDLDIPEVMFLISADRTFVLGDDVSSVTGWGSPYLV